MAMGWDGTTGCRECIRARIRSSWRGAWLGKHHDRYYRGAVVGDRLKKLGGFAATSKN